MFKQEYDFFGHKLACWYMTVGTTFTLELKSYPFIKKVWNARGYKAIRMETSHPDGFPDFLIIKGKEYILMEVKVLKKKQLKVLEDDLVWQFGQLPYMKRSLSQGFNYILTVVKDNQLAYIGDIKCLETYL
jgi:hypothetical protein